MNDTSLNLDVDSLTDSEEEALSSMVDNGHVQLEAKESHTLWNALRDHPDVTMAELEPDVRAVFSVGDL